VLAIPDALRRNIRFVLRGDQAGDAWLEQAEAAALRLAEAWEVAPVSVLEGGSMSLCVRGVAREGRAVVLKVPSAPEEGRAERAALETWKDAATPTVLQVDEACGAFLMEFVPVAGTELTPRRISALLDQLHGVRTSGPFPALQMLLDVRVRSAVTRFAGEAFAAEREALQRARAVLADLQATAGEPCLLHGDFQAKNVLPAGVPVAIDPIPVLGDPLYDTALWVATGSAGPRLAAAAAFCEGSPEPGRLRDWIQALAVLEYRPGTPGAADAREFLGLPLMTTQASLS
jgi:streptomycin 6-kinase